jgi:hypothetical protein
MMLAAPSSRKRLPPLEFGTLRSQRGTASLARAPVAWIVLGVSREGDS